MSIAPAPMTRENPNPNDSAEEAAFLGLLRTFGLIERVMQGHFARFGISGSQWGVLRILHRAEEAGHEALRLTDLSERLLVRPPSVTGLVARLERAGWVIRDISPTDQRAKRVRLTTAGRDLVDGALSKHRQQIGKVMAGLDHEHCLQLDGLLSRLKVHLEGMLERRVATRSAEAQAEAGQAAELV